MATADNNIGLLLLLFIEAITKRLQRTTRMLGDCQKSRSRIEVENKTRQSLCVSENDETRAKVQ